MSSTVSIKIEMDNGDLYELSRPSTINIIERNKPVIVVLTNGDIVNGIDTVYGCDYLNVIVNDNYVRSIPGDNIFGWAYMEDGKIERD